MQSLTYAYITTANFIRDRREALRRRDLGQGTLEYAGLIVLIAAIIAALMSMGIGDDLVSDLTEEIQGILQGDTSSQG